MGRALTLSLAAHAAFVVFFLLLSATRQPLMIPQVARPVRLVTYLEPAAAPRQRTAPVEAVPAARPPAETRVFKPPAPTIPTPVAAPPSAPVPASRVEIPVREQEATASRTPAAPVTERLTLRERLERQLASSTPAESRPAEIAPPRIASLPPAEVAAAAPDPARAVPGPPPAQPGDVTPVGYFPHAWYLALLKKNVYDRWLPPPDPFKNNRPPAALVSFRIDRAGAISEIGLKERSGFDRFDKSALAAVRGLGKVSPLPEQYPEETLDVIIRFQRQ